MTATNTNPGLQPLHFAPFRPLPPIQAISTEGLAKLTLSDNPDVTVYFSPLKDGKREVVVKSGGSLSKLILSQNSGPNSQGQNGLRIRSNGLTLSINGETVTFPSSSSSVPADNFER